MNSKEALARAKYIRSQIEDGIESDEFTTQELHALKDALAVLLEGIDAEHLRRTGRHLKDKVH